MNFKAHIKKMPTIIEKKSPTTYSKSFGKNLLKGI